MSPLSLKDWTPASPAASGAHIADNVRIGADCVIKPGAVIGQDGFGYTREPDGRWTHRPHSGGVEIADDVHIGANTCIDQGTTEPTRIGRGTRIDNLVHVAHNVQIGENVMVIAGAEISGSVVVGDGAWIGPNACIRQHVRIGRNALVGMGAVVLKDVDPDTTVAGNPARVINADVGVRDRM